MGQRSSRSATPSTDLPSAAPSAGRTLRSAPRFAADVAYPPRRRDHSKLSLHLGMWIASGTRIVASASPRSPCVRPRLAHPRWAGPQGPPRPARACVGALARRASDCPDPDLLRRSTPGRCRRCVGAGSTLSPLRRRSSPTSRSAAVTDRTNRATATPLQIWTQFRPAPSEWLQVNVRAARAKQASKSGRWDSGDSGHPCS